LAAILCNEGLILTIIGIVGVFEGFRLNRVSAAADEAYGPGWYLLLLSAILIICGLYYLVSTFKRKNEKTEAAAFSLYGPATFAIVAMSLYSFLLPYIGYLMSTAAFVLAATRVFGEQSWIKSTLLAGISGGIFWFVFVYLAQIPMP
jgi:hypothetical protein